MKRSPMRRTPFKSRRRIEGPTAERERHPIALRRLDVTPNYGGGVSGPVPKDAPPVRDESYKRWVASLPCYECRIQGYSQCAHPNSGKAKGKKLSDAGCFPLCCDRLGIKGCHPKFDQYEIVPREEMPAYERAAAKWTREQRATA